MKALWEKDTFTDEALIGCCELQFRYRKRMAQVQNSIHVRVRKVAKKFSFWQWFSSLRSVRLEDLRFSPFNLSLGLNCKQVITMAEAFCSLLQVGLIYQTPGSTLNTAKATSFYS